MMFRLIFGLMLVFAYAVDVPICNLGGDEILQVRLDDDLAEVAAKLNPNDALYQGPIFDAISKSIPVQHHKSHASMCLTRMSGDKLSFNLIWTPWPFVLVGYWWENFCRRHRDMRFCHLFHRVKPNAYDELRKPFYQFIPEEAHTAILPTFSGSLKTLRADKNYIRCFGVEPYWEPMIIRIQKSSDNVGFIECKCTQSTGVDFSMSRSSSNVEQGIYVQHHKVSGQETFKFARPTPYGRCQFTLSTSMDCGLDRILGLSFPINLNYGTMWYDELFGPELYTLSIRTPEEAGAKVFISNRATIYEELETFPDHFIISDMIECPILLLDQQKGWGYKGTVTNTITGETGEISIAVRVHIDFDGGGQPEQLPAPSSLKEFLMMVFEKDPKYFEL